MKIYITVLFLLATAGIGLLAYTRMARTLPDGQAGIAYTQNEDGEFEVATGERSNERTVIPQREKNDGSDDEWLTRFMLTERSGEDVHSDDLKGTPYVAGFFFSTCPSICVRQNSKVRELQESFQGQQVKFLSISCDPEVDRPEVLREYADKFEADPKQWLFLTGKMNYIRRVGSEFFSLAVERRGHPEKFALMDADGKMYGLYTWSDDGQWDALNRDIGKLIAAGGTLADEKSDEAANTEDPDGQEEPEK